MEVPELESDRLVVDSCRRLTGPSLVWSETGAILDILVADIDLELVIDCWQRHLETLLKEIDWPQPRHTYRRFENGYNLLLAAPIDQLYSAVLALETTWYFCSGELLQRDVEFRQPLLDNLRAQMQQEQNPILIRLQAAAAEHDVDFLADDETISLGLGTGSRSYPIDELPNPGRLNWDAIHDIPVALVTGTNGKSTSVRLLDGIARSAGRVSGITSTDFVRVGDDLLDQGDYSGPGGARLLLRDQRLEVAFLEVARGGILRRGLPLRRARVALVTNIASDHLGQYGVNTLAALTETKLAVRRTLADDGVLVTNADDVEIVSYLAANPQQNLCWLSLDKSNQQIQRHISLRQHCCFSEQGRLVYFDGENFIDICAIDEIPMTLNGAATHNVHNALGAIGVGMAMGFTPAQISAGLQRFHSDAKDNPGRMNHFTLANSSQVIVDFAHNAHGITAMVETIARMPARQKWALFGSAGDRSDEDIRAMALALCSTAPDHVVITEIEAYLRGRRFGEVSQIIKQVCLQNGVDEARIHLLESPLAGVRYALDHMQAQDLGLFFILSERDEVIDYINSR